MRSTLLLCILCLPLLLGGCIREEEYDNTPQGNFDALWTIIDEQYCFLDYKQIDWDAVYDRYRPLITPDMSGDGLFEVLGNMLAELKDGHVNLSSASNTARYWNWYLDYPRNFNEALVESYLGRDYRIGGGANYTILDDNIGYIYYGDFSSGIGEGNLDEMLLYLSICNGLIIDVRGNGGGNLTTATKLAARFTNDKVLTGYILHKTGKGHSDFSDPEPIYLEPSNSIRWQKPVVVLVNAATFSSAENFCVSFKSARRGKIIGTPTGGSTGNPININLGFGIGCCICTKHELDADGNEFVGVGIQPDILVEEDEALFLQNRDNVVEKAVEYLKTQIK